MSHRFPGIVPGLRLAKVSPSMSLIERNLPQLEGEAVLSRSAEFMTGHFWDTTPGSA